MSELENNIIPATPTIVGDAPITEQTPNKALSHDEVFGKGLEDAFNADLATAKGEPPPAAKPKEGEKPVEPAKPLNLSQPADDDIAPDKQWDDRAPVPHKREQWDKFREKHNKLVQEYESVKSKAADLESHTAELSKYQELQQKVTEYEQQIKEASILNDPNLTKDVDSRMKSLVELSTSGLDEKQAAELQGIIQMPPGKHRDKALMAFADDMPPFKQAQLGAWVARADEYRHERDHIIASAKENADGILKQRQTQFAVQQEQMKQQYAKSFDAAASDLAKLPGWAAIFSDSENVKPYLESAKNVYFGNAGTPKDLAKKAITAEIAPAIMEYAIGVEQQLVEMKKANEELEATLKKYKGGSPAPNTLGTKSSGGDFDFVTGAAQAFVTGQYGR